MTLNALNPLFQVLAALIIFVTGFFALFVSIVAAVMLARLGYVGALWALSKVRQLTQSVASMCLWGPRPGREPKCPLGATVWLMH